MEQELMQTRGEMNVTRSIEITELRYQLIYST